MMSLIWEMKTPEFFVIIRLVATKIQNCGNRLQLCVSLVKTAEENKKENEWGGEKEKFVSSTSLPSVFWEGSEGPSFLFIFIFPSEQKKNFLEKKGFKKLFSLSFTSL